MQPDRNVGGICDAVGGRLGQLPRLKLCQEIARSQFFRDPTEDRFDCVILCSMLWWQWNWPSRLALLATSQELRVAGNPHGEGAHHDGGKRGADKSDHIEHAVVPKVQATHSNPASAQELSKLRRLETRVHGEPLPYDMARSALACHPFGRPSGLPSALNTLISIARRGSRMKIAISIAIAMALLLAATIATQFRTDRMTGLVVCDDPTSGDRGSSCRMLSERSN